MRKCSRWCLALACLWSFGARAFDFSLGDIEASLKSRLSTGIDIRVQPQDPDLLAKQNVPGQQHLCDADDCMSTSGDATPNARLVHARGGFYATNGDNGDMNYKQWGVTAATTMAVEDFTANWHDFALRVRGLYYFDPENFDFDETHNNTRFQPAHTQRQEGAIGEYARGGELLDAFLQYEFHLGEHAASVTVGNQVVRWGESTLVQLNSVNEISPPNEAVLHMPGSEIKEVFRAVPLVRLNAELVDHLSTELIYQFGWKPVKADPSGSFFSTNDYYGGAGRYAILGLGQYAEDPNRKYVPPTSSALITSSTRTVYLLPDGTGKPRGAGQYGARLNYYADWLNGGTELDFYYLNYHSRLPYGAEYAADATCIPRGTTSIVVALVACRGFHGTLNVGGNGLEPLPIDTLKPFITYPENIHLYGMSFNTNMGKWSLAGEFAYRPNLPMQIDVSDTIFAGLQPALPDHDIPISPLGGIVTLPPGTPLSALNATIPSNRSAVPDYLSAYRGITVQPHQLILGYERLQMGQLDFTGIRAISSSNPLGADQILFIAELGMDYIFNLPPLNRLQLEGGGFNETHHSPGADGTGSNGAPSSVYTLHLNPTQQNKGFVTAFSWGARFLARLEYDNLIFGFNFKPTLIVSQDFTGIAPYPEQNFIAGVTQVVGGTEVELTRSLSAQALAQFYFGGGRMNNLSDRGNLQLSFSYTF